MLKIIGLGAAISLIAVNAVAAGQHAGSGNDVLPPPRLAAPAPASLTVQGKSPPIRRPGPTAPKNAPNVVVVMLDDVGFGAASTFGGPVATPNLDRLASQGLKYNRFHTTGVCSPSRAALLTGRNSHAVGVGNVLNSSTGQRGRHGILSEHAATIAEILRQHGYATSAWGKWHLTPRWEASPTGPFDRWPTNQGFQKFYGFFGGEMDQFHPTLYDDTTLVTTPRRQGYTLNKDLADRAIRWLQLQHSNAPGKPFFVYFAPGATHAPLQAPQRWIDRFKGKFDQGWDKQRQATFARQKKLGVIPDDAKLTARPDAIPAWDSLSADQKKVAARLMATYAGFLAQTDQQVGRLVHTLKQMGQFDDTLFIYIVGDNGGAPSAGRLGAMNTYASYQGIHIDIDKAVQRLDEIGGPKTYPGYPVGWAWAMDTPFKWTKLVPSYLGATRNPLVITWPDRIDKKGGLRTQFADIDDIFPTILEAVGVPAPARVNGVSQKSIDGTSLIYTFDHPAAKARHRTQYFEVYGNRAIYHEGWMASAFHRRLPWDMVKAPQHKFKNDRWELYNLRHDYSQANDLAAQKPAKLQRMKNLFWSVAARNDVLPLTNNLIAQAPRPPRPNDNRYVYHAGAIGLPRAVAPPIFSRSYTITARVDTKASGGHGVIAAQGGDSGGWSLYLDDAGKPVYVYKLYDGTAYTIRAPKRLPPGQATLRFVFDYDGGGYGQGGTGTLSVNGTSVGHVRLPRTAPAFFAQGATFDVGTDIGEAVGDYAPYSRFDGTIRRVSVTVD